MANYGMPSDKVVHVPLYILLIFNANIGCIQQFDFVCLFVHFYVIGGLPVFKMLCFKSQGNFEKNIYLKYYFQLRSGESRHLPSMWNMINAFQMGSRLTLVDYRDKTGCNLVD
ncbi:hypothetical protein Hanom_Chr17g01543181 [Helianthus anomalus]